MATGAIVARILTQYSDKGSKAAQKDIAKLGKNFDAFAKKTTKAFGIAAAASAAFAVKVGVDAVKAALEDQKSQVILANSLRNTVGASDSAIASIEDYITKQQLLVNVADTALRPSLSALLVATKDLTQAQALQAIALDTSAATGKDLQTVSIAIAKATTGNVGALKKLGVPLSDNIVKTKDFAGAMDVLKKSYGGAAQKLAQTDPLTTLNLAFGEVMETLGYALLPTVKEFANYIITDVLPVVQSWIALNKDKLVESLKSVGEFLVAAGKAAFSFIDYISRNMTTIKVFASILAGIFVASKVSAFVAAIGVLTTAFAGLAAAAGGAGVATALATGGISVGTTAAALGAFAITVGAIGVAGLTSGKYATKATTAFKGMGNISMTTGKQMDGLNKTINTNTTFTNNNATAVKKLTAEQVLSLKVQKQLADQFGVKATSETDPIQLEAARLNLIKQQNLAIQAVDASYLAFIEKQMKANENAQRYADILKVIKDGKITTEEIDNLAKAWGIPRDQVIAYITKVTGIAQTSFSGLDTPGLTAASGWDTAKKSLDAYYAALLAGTKPSPTPTPTNPFTGLSGAETTASALAAAVNVTTGGVYGKGMRLTAGGEYQGYNPDMARAGMTSGGQAPTNNFYITTVDPSKAGDAVVDAINNSANIRGGYTAIGLSRAVTIL